MPDPLHVLLVEDSSDDARLLERELRAGGYETEIERVDSAATMRAMLAGHRWDLVLADYSLPHFSAHEALAVLHECGQDIPFIVVSGAVGEETAVALLKAGAHDFVPKGRWTRLLPAVRRELTEASHRREARQADEMMRLSEARYRRLFELAGDGILILNGETGRVVEANPALLALIGFGRDQVVGARVWELGCFRDIATSAADFATFFARDVVRRGHLVLVAADGRPRAVEFDSNAYVLAEHRVVQCSIRELGRAEAARRGVDEKFQRLMDGNVVGVFVADAERLLEANDWLRGTFCLSAAALERGLVRWEELFFPERAALARRVRETLAREARLPSMPLDGLAGNGTPMPVLLAGTALGGEPFAWIGLVVDPTAGGRLDVRLPRQSWALAVVPHDG